ncbi:NAD-dependent epimerase/dehydratase family protein [Chryseolinea sp. H1M3-3]|uniref:NAD-dependent epimerase/dehydratase family protein n=1 Tax=Chryseolinea sp. H1M3-3 TaxID=3034144 RepID=UPI0023EA9140|nr:NAD-dependent epimerase/dehydratase family protein [Chryseolinea sp. H1M3-3]
MILLTGGSGFIGSHFQRSPYEEQFINLDLNEPKFQSKAAFSQGDIRRKEDVSKAIQSKNIKSIISLAAKHHDFGIGHAEYFDTNEDGTAVICEVASENGIKEIIFFSSVAVYGIRGEVSTELTTPQPDSPYGASKLAGEKVLQKWADEAADRKVLIIRPTLVFGPNNMANMRNLIRQIDSGLYFHLGKADNIKSIAYVENLVNATLYLKNRIKPGVSIYNYADEPQLTTRQISDTIAHALNKKIRVTVPKTLGIMMGIPFDVMIKVTGKNFPISSARIKKLGTQTHHSAQKIFQEGFRPSFTTLDGLRKMVEWYKEETSTVRENDDHLKAK